MDSTLQQQKKRLVSRHLLLGWMGLLVFIALGFILETMHAFKVPEFLNVEHETRRMMWRLAHAHGSLLAVLHLGFAFTCSTLKPSAIAHLAGAHSLGFSLATILIPVGFFGGGLGAVGGDPGSTIALVPAGAALLVFSILGTLRELARKSTSAAQGS